MLLQDSITKAEAIGLREEELARYERKNQSPSLRHRVSRSQAATFQKIRVYMRAVEYFVILCNFCTFQNIGGSRVFIIYFTQIAYVFINVGSWLVIGNFDNIKAS